MNLPTPANAPVASTCPKPRGASAPPAAPQVVDYDWRVPHRFTSAQQQRLAAFARKAADRIATELRHLIHRPVAVEVGGVAEHYGADVWTPRETPLYGVALVDEADQVCGMVGLPPEIAVRWVESLLGGAATTAKEARPLSPLEAMILLDVVEAMAKGFSAASKEVGAPALRRAEKVSSDQSPLAECRQGEFGKITLTTEGDQGQAAFWVAVLSSSLVAIADPNALKKQARTAEETHADLAGHMENATVQATARLGTVAVTVRDVAALEPGDVLLLGKSANAPVDVLVLGNVVFRGRPVTCDGRYAVQVQECKQWS